MQVEVLSHSIRRRPRRIGAPGIRSCLKGHHLPGEFLPLPVQKVTEERRLDVLAELQGSFMSAQGNAPDSVAFHLPLPGAMRPGARDHEIIAMRAALIRLAKDLPRPPRVFLIPEPGNVQYRNFRTPKLASPGVFFPIRIVIRMTDNIVPERQRAVQILRIDVREGAETQIPTIGIVEIELERCVRVFVGLLPYRVLEGIAQT